MSASVLVAAERAQVAFAQLAAPQRSIVALGAAVATGTAAAGVAAVAGTEGGPELCVVRHWFGGYCPGCGGARAARHLVQGDLAAAWADHPWVIVGAAQLALISVLAVIVVVVRPNGPALRSETQMMRSWRPSRTLQLLAVSNAVLLVGIWMARLVNGSIPSPF